MATASELPSLTNSASSQDREECHYLGEFVWRKSYLTDDTYKSLVALICVNSLTIIPTILLNALVIFVVVRRPRLRTSSNILLACLAGADVLNGVVVIPIAIAVAVKRAFGFGPFCTLEKGFSVVLWGQGCATLTHLVLISIDRYCAIKYPLRYKDIVTTRRIRKAVLLAWVITVFVTIQEIVLATSYSGTKLYAVYWTVSIVINALFVLFCIVSIAYCYLYILSETRRQKKRLQTEQLSQEEAKNAKKNCKAAYTLTMILGTLALTYLPAIVYVIISVFANIVEPRVTSALHVWTDFFVILSSLLNPIIYCWRNNKLRRAFLEIFHFRKPENCPPEIEMAEIQRHGPEIQHTSEAFPVSATNQEPVFAVNQSSSV